MESNSEDLFIKPGNHERGWNDPPQFSYGLQAARAPHRNPLTRRAPPAGSGTPPVTPPSSALTPPRASVAPLPFSPVPPPPIGSSVATPPPPVGPSVAPPPPPIGSSVATPPQSDCVQEEQEVQEVMSVLGAALEACRSNTSVQVCNDVGKRLKLLEENWRSGRLSAAVRRRMRSLASDLKSGLWDSADEAHRSLMVDHVTEVSQWMVGVKRLIAETRKLSPEQLRPLSRDPDLDSADRDLDRDSADRDLDSADRDRDLDSEDLTQQAQEELERTPVDQDCKVSETLVPTFPR